MKCPGCGIERKGLDGQCGICGHKAEPIKAEALQIPIQKLKSTPYGFCVCKNCGFIGKGKTVTPGMLLIELFLWICMLIPGLIYSIWRLTNRIKVCPKCGQQGLLPPSTPIGRQMFEAQGYKV